MAMGKSPECKTCGYVGSGFADIMRHYRESHPGQKSPAQAAREAKKAAGNGGAKSAAAVALAGAGPAADPATAPAPPGPPDDSEPSPEFVDGETPPDLGPDAVTPTLEPAKRSWKDRLWAPRDKPAKVPKRLGPRVSGAELLSGAWGLLGMGLIRTGADVPVGRCLQFQAPAAGEILDHALAGSLLDRAIIQPIASRADDAEAIAALVGLPLLVFAYERATDELRPVLEPLLVEALRAHLTAMVPVMRKKQAKDRELAKVVDDLRGDGLLPEGAETADEAIQAMYTAIFQPAEEPAPPEYETV